MKIFLKIVATLISLMLLIVYPSGFITILFCVGIVALFIYLIIKCWPLIVASLGFFAWVFAFFLALGLLTSKVFWYSIFGFILFFAAVFVFFKVIFSLGNSSGSSSSINGSNSDSDYDYESSSFSPSEERAFLEAERIKDIKRNL